MTHSPAPSKHPAAQLRVLRIQSRICVGGPALNTILLSAGLSPNRFHTILVGGRLEPDEKSMAPLAVEKGVDLRLIEEMGRSIRWSDDLRALWRLIKLIREFRPHIAHTHTAKAGAMGRLAAFLCRVPIRLHTFHGHTFHGYFSPTVTRLFIWIERFLALLSHRIVVISERQREDICAVYKVAPPRKTVVVPLGFELAKMRMGQSGRFRGSLGMGPEVTLVGILARLVPIKNHDLLLRAIAVFCAIESQASPEAIRFVIIGDGELRATLEAQAVKLGIAPFVIFAGWRSDVPDIYADLDLNVLTSKNEGTPVTLIEGLTNGVPILATDVGGIRDFADERHGRIVPADIEATALGAQLAQMLPGGRRPERLPESLRAEIQARFDVSRLVEDVTKLYESLATERLAGRLD